MVYTEGTGVILIAIGASVLVRPMQVRSFASADQWETDPERAKREQRAYATMLGAAAVLSGIFLIGLGLTGAGP